jgi:hypothetical protein
MSLHMKVMNQHLLGLNVKMSNQLQSQYIRCKRLQPFVANWEEVNHLGALAKIMDLQSQGRHCWVCVICLFLLKQNKLESILTKGV